MFPTRPQTSRANLLGALALVATIAAASGCVERRMTIRSNPPGALVYVDGYEIGTTPCSTSFIYYGQRQIRLVKDGYETLTVIQPVSTPWYEIPGVDFFSENLVPGKIRDQRVFDFVLQRQIMVPPQQLRERAESLRHGVQASSMGPSQPIPGLRVNPPSQPIYPAPSAVGGQMVYPEPGVR